MCSKQNRRSKLNVFDRVIRINKSKTLPKQTRECKYKVDGRISNSNPKWNNDKCHVNEKIWENILCAEKFISGILVHLQVKMVNI